jgi:hypothetical protein
MLNVEAFRDLCCKAFIEQDPAKLETIKDALRFMLRTEEIQVCRVQWKPAQEPN